MFRDYVSNIKAPDAIIPDLIDCFAGKIVRAAIETFGDLKDPGSLFVLEDGTEYKYAGMFNGVKYASVFNSDNLEALDPSTRIKWIF